jgi:hypothetical protein
MVIVSLPNGKKKVDLAKTQSSPETRDLPVAGPPGKFRRIGWREITR